METIKINFVASSSPRFDYKKNFFYRFLAERYHVELSDKPDYLFCGCSEHKHWKYKDCIKIFYTGENVLPDFNIYDYGISFYYLTLEDRYLRFPLWLTYSWDALDKMGGVKSDLQPERLLNRKFCSFLHSSVCCDPIREEFFKKLSRYKKVDSGGRFLNNIGYRVPDKLQFIKDYKFTIGIENSAVPGYTTEKIIEPMMVDSVPIYYGDPCVGHDFNMQSCVHLRDYDTLDDAVDAIIELDRNDDLYMAKLKEQWFSRDRIKQAYEKELEEFFARIFGRGKESRLTDYGCQHNYRKEMRRVTPWAQTLIVEKGYGLLDRIEKLKSRFWK